VGSPGARGEHDRKALLALPGQPHERGERDECRPDRSGSRDVEHRQRFVGRVFVPSENERHPDDDLDDDDDLDLDEEDEEEEDEDIL